MIGIVIAAYNRAEPLLDLLNSLNNVHYNNNEQIPLVISIDNQGTEQVNKIANEFNWKYGSKEVVIHEKKLGLVKHFIWVGDQTERFDNVLFLEDDLIVSPDLLNYALQLIPYYKDNAKVAAASLYNPILNEGTGTKFYQLVDGYDVYFLQHPYWGNIWFKDKWREFKKYLETYVEKRELLPPHIAQWTKSFKKKYIQFLIETGYTVVTPRVSIVSNNGCMGLHNDNLPFMWQTPIIQKKDTYSFCEVDDSLSIYDAYEEITSDVLKNLNPILRKYVFTVDLNGTKQLSGVKTEYILTSKKTSAPELSFTSLMKPAEQGVIYNLQGDKEISLCKVSSVVEDRAFYNNRKKKDILKNYSIRPSLNFYRITQKMFFSFAFSKIKGYFKK